MIRFFVLLFVTSASSLAQSPELVKDLYSGAVSGWPHSMIKVGKNLFFSASTLIDNNSHYSLWKTDGTTGGTVLVKSHIEIDDRTLTGINDILYFAASDENGTELWRSDGTTEGTVMVKDIHTTGSSYPRKLTNVNGTLFFIASDLQNVDQLWKSDGSLNGTIPVKRLSNDFGFPVGQPQMISFKNKLHYLYTSDSELQLWQSDGSLDGTLPVKVLSYGGDFLVNFNNRQLLFTGPQGWFGSTLWQSDGTSEGTSTIQTINGEKLAFISQPVVLNDNSYFYGFSSNGIIGLWKYDGVNLQLIKHPLQSYHSMYYNGKVPIIDNVLYFRAFSTDNRNNLWRSDATENGTFAIPVVNEGIIYEDVQEITALRNKIYFTARSVQLEKRFLFVSDGTEAGTKRLFEVPYQRHEERSNVILGAYDGTLYLRLRDSAHGLELWKYTPDEKKCLPVVVSKIK